MNITLLNQKITGQTVELWTSTSTKLFCRTLTKCKDDLDLPLGQRALVIFECFRGQITEEFTAKLSANRLIYVTIPPNCTDLLQPMDLNVNKSAKSFLKNEFESWYAAQVCDQLSGSADINELKVDL